MGPLPWGSAKQSIMTVVKKWGWLARPIGPVGQSADRTGVMWELQSSIAPTHCRVWTLSHGDVLITEQVAHSQIVNQSPTILASTKTLNCLKQGVKEDHSKPDPWLHHDPWTKTAKEISSAQLSALESKLEQRLMPKLKQEDVQMSEVADAKVQNLEQQVVTMKQTIETMSQAQASHVQNVQSQLDSHVQCITQLDAKVDANHKSTAHMFQQKLDEQMQRIESLFNKKARVGE